MFKYSPLQYVKITPLLGAHGRIERCIKDNGPIFLYNVNYFINGDSRNTEFYEDELEPMEDS